MSDTSGDHSPATYRDAFVEWVQNTVARIEIANLPWCEQWWDHPEAVDRFHALYRAWLQASLEDSRSSWWINHWDRHTHQLFTRHGIFHHCRHQGHTTTRPTLLTTKHPPHNWTLPNNSF